MTTTWADTKHQAIKAFNGELPTADTEQTVIDAFQTEPLAVLQALHGVIETFKAGKARSGWALWKYRIASVLTTPDVTVETHDRPAQIKLTETFIRNTAGYITTETELHDEVFGPRGRLYRWNDDTQLVDRIHAYWETQRPRFEAAETEAITRQHQQGDTYRRLRKTMRHYAANLDPDEHATRIANEVERAKLAYLDTIAPDPDE